MYLRGNIFIRETITGPDIWGLKLRHLGPFYIK